MTDEEASNYNKILCLLGMDEGGDPVKAVERMRDTLRGICDADWRRWEEPASPDEFVRWAKARASHALRVTPDVDGGVAAGASRRDVKMSTINDIVKSATKLVLAYRDNGYDTDSAAMGEILAELENALETGNVIRPDEKEKDGDRAKRDDRH